MVCVAASACERSDVAASLRQHEAQTRRIALLSRLSTSKQTNPAICSTSIVGSCVVCPLSLSLSSPSSPRYANRLCRTCRSCSGSSGGGEPAETKQKRKAASRSYRYNRYLTPSHTPPPCPDHPLIEWRRTHVRKLVQARTTYGVGLERRRSVERIAPHALVGLSRRHHRTSSIRRCVVVVVDLRVLL
jgi:hypothetical protein